MDLRGAWEGVWAIPVTPFDQSLEIVWEEVVRQVDFAVEAGADGIVGPILASEVYTYSDRERFQFYEVVAEAVAGRVPFVAGVSGASVAHAVELATAATRHGADGLIAMAPLVGGKTAESTERYFTELLQQIELPLIIQNAPANFTPPVSTAQLIRLANSRSVVGVKEEAVRSPSGMGILAASLPEPKASVFGGFGGLHLPNELARGVKGTMVACEFTDVVAKIFRLHHAGAIDGVLEVFRDLLPMLVFEQMYGMRFAKHCLSRRGIIANTYCRDPFPELDATDMALIGILWDRLATHFSYR